MQPKNLMVNLRFSIVTCILLIFSVACDSKYYAQHEMLSPTATSINFSPLALPTTIPNEILVGTPSPILTSTLPSRITTPAPVINGRMAFVSLPIRDEYEIYILNIKCTRLFSECDNRLVRLLDKDGEPYTPSWSPDGQHLAFVSNRFVDYPDTYIKNWAQIYVINDDGSNEIRLTHTPLNHWRPIWSPNGTRIAFSGQDGIHIINPDGRGLTLISSEIGIESLSWSPDSTRLAVGVWTGEGAVDSYVLRADGNKATNDRYNPYVDNSISFPLWSQTPVWSPNGDKIAFVKGDEIYVKNVGNNEETNLTNHPAKDKEPVWSPDGKYLTFISNRDGNEEIYIMNADGSGQTNLTNHLASDNGAAWSPDGRFIAFRSTRNDTGSDCLKCDSCSSCNYEIYMMNTDGSEQTRLTNNQACDFFPVWAPQ